MADPMDSFLEYRESRDDVLQPSLSQDAALMGFPDSHVANYDFPMLPQDGDLTLANFDRIPPSQPELEGHLSDVMLNYESVPSSGVSMPLSLDATNAFYVPTTYPAAPMGHAPSLDQTQLHSTYPQFQPHLPAQYLQQQRQQPPLRALPARKELYTSGNSSTASLDDLDFSRPSERSPALARPLVQGRARPQPSPLRATQPVAIQPKKPPPAQGLNTPDASRSEHAGIYSGSGFDILGVLVSVASRPNPQINIGAVDLSCAFVLCDILKPDSPIVYVSEAFERLTGYVKDEIVGRNCRFLQDPEGQIQAGAARSFVDAQTVYRLRSTIDDRSEIQASIINYRKGGQPFMNLITMIPIQWDSGEYRFYVGFQVDLVEKPDAITRRNADGTYSINYQRDQLPKYVVPPPEIYRIRPDLATRFDHNEVSAILNAVGAPGSNLSRDYLDRILVENTDDVIHVLSLNSEFLYVSPSCKKILEYDPIELVGKTLSAVCHPSDIGPVIRDLRASTTSAPISVVYRIRQKYRGYIWFESHGSWHIDPHQGRTHVVMTGRPRPVYALDQIAGLGSSAALAENDIWAKVSLSGVLLFVTSKVKSVLGRTPDDLIGKSLHELMEPGTDASDINKALEAAIAASDPESNTLSAHTTLYAGDLQEDSRPSFLVAQIRFVRSSPAPAAATLAANDDKMGSVPGSSKPTTLVTKDANPPGPDGVLGQRPVDLSLVGLNGLPSGNRSASPSDPATFFTELNPTRGSNWQIELRELEKQNRTLTEELQRLLSRRKKRKRKQSAVSVEKACAMCNTPEYARMAARSERESRLVQQLWPPMGKAGAQSSAATCNDGSALRACGIHQPLIERCSIRSDISTTTLVQRNRQLRRTQRLDPPTGPDHLVINRQILQIPPEPRPIDPPGQHTRHNALEPIMLPHQPEHRTRAQDLRRTRPGRPPRIREAQQQRARSCAEPAAGSGAGILFCRTAAASECASSAFVLRWEALVRSFAIWYGRRQVVGVMAEP
ncbi:White collar 1 protein [Penicillium chermesinum]|uniref:White collar 1 protein n=1 Tax=Penicillium chermesinum TaxID=63820 RepID=A0A9W9NHF5_9EURO|nr:White collar 1 protein [Penicillium chermesinum]KAJ5219823.1 White collar 1 protein [Penicillium chermesinum]